MTVLKSNRGDRWMREAERCARRDASRRAFLSGSGAMAGALLLPDSAEAGRERIRQSVLSKRGHSAWAENRPPAGTARSLPTQLFPADNWWNLDISAAPLDPDSATYMAGLNFVPNTIFDHTDGNPWATVSSNYPLIAFDHCATADESDLLVSGPHGVGPPGYPIPIPAITQRGWTENVGIAPALNETLNGGQDRHLFIVDPARNYLYELYEPYHNETGSTVVISGLNVLPGQWYTYSATFFDMNTNDQRPDGWTSADAAGLQILPGCVSFDEVMGAAEITHAHGICLNFGTDTPPHHVWPARHDAANFSATHPPFGARFRLKSSFNLAPYLPEAQRLGRALKTHGFIFKDNSANGDVTGLNDERWGDYYTGADGVTWGIQVMFNAMNLSTQFELVELGWGAP